MNAERLAEIRHRAFGGERAEVFDLEAWCDELLREVERLVGELDAERLRHDATQASLDRAHEEIETISARHTKCLEALRLIQRVTRNSREAPNALDTIAFAAREALASVSAGSGPATSFEETSVSTDTTRQGGDG